jgi:hypothetical protein
MDVEMKNSDKAILEEALEHLVKAKESLDVLPHYTEVTDQITEIEEWLHHDIGELEDQE